MFSLLWSEHCAYKHSKQLLRRLPTEGPRVLMGPGENAGAVDVGERPRGRVQGRVAQPPERGRALPGRGDGRRRDPARRLRGRRATDRGARLAALRRARRPAARATCSSGAVAGIGSLRQLDRGRRRSAARSTSRRPTSSNCLVNAMCVGLAPPDRLIRSAAAAVREPARAAGRAARAATGSAALGAGQRRARRRRRVEAPDRPDRRPVRGEEAARVLPRAARRATLLASLQDLGAAGLSRRAVGDGHEGRGRARHRRLARAAARGRHGAVRGHGLRVAGADAVRGGAGPAGRGARASARAGRCARRRSARSPTRAGCACSTATSWSATCRWRRWSTSARCTTSSRRRRPSPVYPAPPTAAR